jgi:hypothetical protein
MLNWFNRKDHHLEWENKRLKRRNTHLENEMDILINKINGLHDSAVYIKYDIDNPEDIPSAYDYVPRIKESKNVKAL